MGIDAKVEGNDPLSLSTVDSCVSVSRDDVFDIDIYIRDVEELLAWEVYIGYDPTVLEVVGRDVEMFLAGNPGSSVLDVSGHLPNRDGLYRAAAADTSDPPTPDSGSGVLVRLSLKALNRGTTDIELITRDVDGDGLADLGPLLRNVDADVLGDTNGDTIFDGPIDNAKVAVETDCEGGSPVGAPATTSDGVSPALIAIAAVGGALALLTAGLVAFRLVRRSRVGSG